MITEHYRVSRYAPDAVLDDTWTGRADIGRVFGGTVLTAAAYEAVEDAYVRAHTAFLRHCAVGQLVVLDLQIGRGAPTWARTLGEGDPIGADQAARIIRPMLREEMSARLESPDRFYLHIGYDLLTWVGTSEAAPFAVAEARAVGLFVEPGSPSPFVPDAGDRFWWLSGDGPVRHRVASFDAVSGTPLDRWTVPDAVLADVLAAVPARADDPEHVEKYVLTDTQVARVLPLLGGTPDPTLAYTLVTYDD